MSNILPLRSLVGRSYELEVLGKALTSANEGTGAEALSQRELEITRLVARRKSSKAIAKELEVSTRTVSTHISNTFQKLQVGSRGEWADYARAHSLLSREAGA